MKGNLWTIAVLFIGLLVLLPAVNVAFADAAQSAAANESTTVDHSTNYTLGVTNVEEYTALNVSANDTELTNGTDYLFDPSNATIDWQDTSATSDGDDAAVNYTYTYYDDTTQTVESTLATVGVWVGYAAVMAVLGYLLLLIPGGSGW